MRVKGGGEIELSKLCTARLEQVPKALQQAISDETTLMVRRIKPPGNLSGSDVDGKPFEHYKPEYANWKDAWRKGLLRSRKRHSRKNRGPLPQVNPSSVPVDLWKTGRMLSAITYKFFSSASGSLVAKLVIGGAEAVKARRNIELGRNFFGFSKEQIERLRKKVKDILKGAK